MLCSQTLPLKPAARPCVRASAEAPERFQWKGGGAAQAQAWTELTLAGRGGFAPEGTGLEIFVCDEGPEGSASPPVVLLHGFPGHSFCWRNVAPQLAAAGKRVILLDLPGCGSSSKPQPDAFDGYSLARLSECVRAVLEDALELKSYQLAGFGFSGGLIAAVLASQRPAQVTNLVLMSTPLTAADVSTGAPPPLSSLLNPLTGMIFAQNALALSGTPIEKGNLFKLPAEDMAAYIAPALADSGVGWASIAYAKGLRASGARSLAEALPLLEKRKEGTTTLIMSVEDPWLKDPAGVLLGARRVSMTGAGHYLMEDWPDKTAENLLSVLM